MPGVVAVGAASGLPPRRDLNANDTEFEGLEADPNGPPLNIDYYQFTTDEYLETMDIDLIAGRRFGPSDDAHRGGGRHPAFRWEPLPGREDRPGTGLRVV